LKKGVGVAEYQHMKSNKVKDLSALYKLSDSVKTEIEGKVKQTGVFLCTNFFILF
jgi:hypothetical protein